MPQFFIDRNLDEGMSVEIRGADAHHISDVLRLIPGDWLVLSDGQGNSFRSVITDAKARSVTVRIEGKANRPSGRTPPTLAIASIRSERLEWAVQKCVELGTRQIITYNSHRTVRTGAATNGGRKTKRLKRIALEAAKQSGLPLIPAVDGPIEFEELCAQLGLFDPAILLYEGECENDLRSIWEVHRKHLKGKPSKPPLIVIGPEGGFTQNEVETATEHGAITSSLGSQILRVETAAVAAMTICQYELGNMNAR